MPDPSSLIDEWVEDLLALLRQMAELNAWGGLVSA